MSKNTIKFNRPGIRHVPKKPFGFCCSIENYEPPKKPEQLPAFFKSTSTPFESAPRGPQLKLQTEQIESSTSEQKKKASLPKYPKYDPVQDMSTKSQNLPLQWYLEDEIALVRDMYWNQKQDAYNKQMIKNIAIGKKKTRDMMKAWPGSQYPKWYQDFSFDQLRNLACLQSSIKEDYEEMVTGRTLRTLMAIGIVSTFFKLKSTIIRKLQKACGQNVIEFLREIYKLLSGNYFEDEGHKDSYDCNERIILSGIAFLTLPEAIWELHKRLPPVIMPKFPPKPQPPACPQRKRMPSPYQEDLFTRPDWARYLNNLQAWRAYCKLIPIPKVILPDPSSILTTVNTGRTQFNIQQIPKILKSLRSIEISQKVSKAKEQENIDTIVSQEDNNVQRSDEKGLVSSLDQAAFDIPRLPDENKVFNFTISGLSEKPGPVEYKICGKLNPPHPYKKSWLGEKHAQYIISGVPDNPPTCPVTYEMTGIANVTPTNSDERFLAVLKLGDGPKKIYPSGRKNLSKNWQEWLQNTDEEFKKVEREANRMIKNIEATMRLVFPGPTCDSCCSCRQTRKSHIKWRETKAPYFVIDTVAEDDDKNKYIVGSMAMHSPAPSPPESTVNLLEVIASEDRITTNLIINGVTNDKGETQYYITGMKKETVHIPSRVVEPPPPPPLRNVPACACAVHQIFNKGLSPTMSSDNIPWTKADGKCFGKKYRPDETGAYSCKTYPGDKSCRRNPFTLDIVKLKRKKEREKEKKEKGEYPAKDKKMYSIAEFQPCGDEHGSPVCSGPWGAKNLLTPEELEEQERIRKEILRSPPCGTKPGRAVCEGPFGAKIPLEKKVRTKVEDEFMMEGERPEGFEEEEDEETEEEEEEEEEAPPPVVKEKPKIRDKSCYMSPESIAARTKVVKKKVGKFIPDPNYHGYDDLWNIHRTAPTEEEFEAEYEHSLKLSSPAPQRSDVQKVTEVKKEVGERNDLPAKIKTDKKKDVTATGFRTEKNKGEKSKGTGTRKSKLEKKEKDSRTSAIAKVSRQEQKESKLIEGKVIEDAKPVMGSSIGISASESVSSKLKPESTSRRKSPQRFATDDKQKVKTKSVVGTMGKSVKSSIGKPIKKLKQKDNRDMEVGHSKIKSKTRQIAKKQTNLKRSLLSTNVKGKNGKQKRPVSSKSDTPSKKSSKNVGQVDNRKVSSTRSQKSAKQKPQKRDSKKKDVLMEEDIAEDIRKTKIAQLKSMMTAPESCPIDVEPAILPEEHPLPCQHECKEEERAPSIHSEAQSETNLIKKGPCGWRTKSEQNLSVKKNLAYLAEKDDPVEMVPVRPGGKSCTCREYRNKKKVLQYNIGGFLDKKKPDSEKVTKLLRKKKDNEDESNIHIIEGVLYYTPPPSPRRSEEYVPEYDLLESPYDMCLSQRKDDNLKLMEQHAGPISLTSKALKNKEPCGCNDYLETYGIFDPENSDMKEKELQEIDKTKQDLIEGKSVEERWYRAFKDAGLVDYFTRCRNNLPCWLKCSKFNKESCTVKYRKLKMKRPVCECKYERKVLEHKEERQNWKKRQQKLKSLKKQPFMNVVATSRPVEADTKLLISDVKRIPRDDEYKDDIKYCITGVAENYTMLPPQPIIDGLKMITPFATPEPSKEKIRSGSLHRHWSPINVTPGPLPRKDAAYIEEMKKRKEALEEAYRQIYAPVVARDDRHKHSCQAACNSQSDEDQDFNEINNLREDDKVGLVSKVGKLSDLRSSLRKERLGGKESPETIRASLKQGIKWDEDKQQRTIRDKAEDIKSVEKKEKSENTEPDLKTLAKAELEKMAEEGYLFARIPKSFRMPQLQDWLTYRKGVHYTDADKKNIVRNMTVAWNIMNSTPRPRIKPGKLNLTKKQLRSLTFDHIDDVKKEIAEKTAIFQSEVRKERVNYSRSMWDTMEYRKFPNASFKKSYFTYMASKEADGHVFRPWYTSEVRDKPRK